MVNGPWLVPCWLVVGRLLGAGEDPRWPLRTGELAFVDEKPLMATDAVLLAAAELGRLLVPFSERPPPLAPMPACPAEMVSSSDGDGCFKGIPTAR